MAEYVKLGNASKGGQFYDPKSGLHVVGDEIVEITDTHKSSEKVANALSGGHIVPVSQYEYMKSQPQAQPKVKEKAKTKEEKAKDEAKALEAENLLKSQLEFLNENFEFNAEEEALFLGYSLEDRLEYIANAKSELNK